MSNVYHTPIGFAAAATTAIINAALGSLDSAVLDLALGEFLFTELAVNPSTPSTNKWKMFFKSNGMNILDDTGAVTPFGGSTITAIVPRTPFSGSASLSITGIPATYDYLLLLANLRNTDTTTSGLLRVNDDTTVTNFDSQKSEFGSSAAYARNAGVSAGFEITITGSTTTAGMSTVMAVIFHAYAATGVPRQVQWHGYYPETNGGTSLLGGGVWENTTDAISSIQLIKTGAGNFATPSSYALYGLSD